MDNNINNDALSVDSPLPSTVQEITATCPKFRILVLGKTGCGKSSLINKVFGLKEGDRTAARVSHDNNIPGEANIDHEICPSYNDRFILHDSRGFEAGDGANFHTVKHFIEERSKMPLLKDRLHAIWICTSVSVSGDRVKETGVENILESGGGVPLIVVFTKYDILVNSTILDVMSDSAAIIGLDDEQIRERGKKIADATFQAMQMGAWPRTVPVMKVSTQPRYKDSITRLIKTTDEEVRRHMQGASLPWAIAQRGDSDLNTEASIDVGRKKYWSGLLASTDFTGEKLRRCLDTIHGDVVSVWNIRDPDNYLACKDFRATMTLLVDDLAGSPSTPTSSDGLTLATVTALGTAVWTPFGIAIASVGSAVLFSKWVLDVYQRTPGNVACVMGYIVDLTIIMHRLSTIDVSKERVLTVVEGYAKSGEIAQVHNDIRTFVNHIPTFRLGNMDSTLNEIMRLIEKHRVSALQG